MKEIRKWFVTTLMFLYLLMGFTNAFSQIKDDVLRKEMEAVYQIFNAAIVAEDVKALEAIYDGKFTLQVGEDEVLDRDEVMNIWKGQFEQMEYAFSKTTVVKTSLTKTGYAFAEVKWEYKGTQTNAKGKKSTIEVVNKSYDIWSKSNGGKWKLFSREDGGTEGKIDGKPIG